MKIKNLLSFLVSTCLAPFPLLAARTDPDLADAYNWNSHAVPAEHTRRAEWRQERTKEFREDIAEANQEFRQAESLSAPLARKGSEDDRIRINALCDFLQRRAERLGFAGMLFEGYLEEGPPDTLHKSASDLGSALPTFGRHLHLTRMIEAITHDITTTEVSLQEQPQQAHELKKQLKGLALTYEKENKNLKKTVQQRGNAEEALARVTAAFGDVDGVFKTTQVEKTRIEGEIQGRKQAYEVVQARLDQEDRDLQAELERLLQSDEFESDSTSASESVDPVSQDISQEGQPVPVVPGGEKAPAVSEENCVAVLQRKEEIKRRMTQITAEKEAVSLEYRTVMEELAHRKREQEELTSTLKANHAKAVKDLEKATKALCKIKETEEGLREALEKIEGERAGHERTLASQDSVRKEGMERLEVLRHQKQALEDEADSIAFGKYIVFENAYRFVVALMSQRHPDFQSHPLTVHPYDVSLVEEFIKEAAGGVFQVGFQAGVAAARVQAIQSMIAQLGEMLPAVLKKPGGVRTEQFVTLTKEVILEVARALPETLEAAPITSPEYKEDVVLSQEELIAQSLDRSLRETADEWKALIRKGEDSWAVRSGLASSLLNDGFAPETHPRILSYEALVESCPEILSLAQKDADLDDSAVWQRAEAQLKMGHFSDLISQNNPARERIIPIYRFVSAKAQKGKSAADVVLNEAGVDPREKTFWQALTEMGSYMSMYYALTHNEKGEPISTLQVEFPSLGIKFPLQERIDILMAREAHRLYTRIVRDFGDYLDQFGLRASLFAPHVLEKFKGPAASAQADLAGPAGGE